MTLLSRFAGSLPVATDVPGHQRPPGSNHADGDMGGYTGRASGGRISKQREALGRCLSLCGLRVLLFSVFVNALCTAAGDPVAGLSRRPDHAPTESMSAVVKKKKPVWRAQKPRTGARGKGNPLGIKAVPGNLFAGLEHVFGSVALPRDPIPPREIIRARIIADHNT